MKTYMDGGLKDCKNNNNDNKNNNYSNNKQK